MDRLLYVALGGATQTLNAQAVNSHNLANANTTGFRADTHSFEHLLVRGPGHASRVNTLAATQGFDASSGSVNHTGRDLDVAVAGSGWIAVQAPDGSEAYTRAGDLRLTALGQLTTADGLPVLGDNGPIAVPPHAERVIGSDGTISIVPQGASAATLAVIDRIKLVDPPTESLVKREDGLIAQADGSPAVADAGGELVAGALESSNVNAVGALVDMIELARRFELQVKAISTAEENADTAARIMRVNGG